MSDITNPDEIYAVVPESTGTILWVMDERLPRDRGKILTRLVNTLKPHHKLEVIHGQQNEEELIEFIQKKPYSLVVLPWYKYFAWTKLDGVFGTLRLTGSTVAGYFAEPVLPYELSDLPNFHRGILLDCLRFEKHEVNKMLSLLTNPKMRAGIAHALGASTTLFRDTWFGFDSAGPGMMDNIMNLPFLHRHPWTARRANIRLCANILWSLVYDIGPGKTDLLSSFTAETERAQFEIGSNGDMMAMRVVYTHEDKTPKDFLRHFWPDQNHALEIQQILAKNSDFIKVHVFPESNRVEVCIFFLKSALAKENPIEVRGFWVEPLSEKHADDATPKDQTVIKIARTHGKGSGPAVPSLPAAAVDPEILLQQVLEINRAASEYCSQLTNQIDEIEKRKPDAPEVMILRHKLMGIRQRQFAWSEKLNEVVEDLKIKAETKTKTAA